MKTQTTIANDYISDACVGQGGCWQYGSTSAAVFGSAGRFSKSQPPRRVAFSAPSSLSQRATGSLLHSGKAVVTHLYIKLERNRSLNGCSEALCDNADEIVNAFVHEKDHIKRALEMGYYKWRDTVSTPEGHKDIEESAIAAQRAHDSWNGCRNSFKEGIRNYENTL